MRWQSLSLPFAIGGLMTCSVLTVFIDPTGAALRLPNGETITTDSHLDVMPVGTRLANVVPVAGVLTRVNHDGGDIILRRQDSQGRPLEQRALERAEMSVPSHRLTVPPRSGTNIGFRPANRSGTIPGYLVRAGSSIHQTEYWYPCNGHRGRFVMGWSEGGGTPTCSQVRLGITLERPKALSKSAHGQIASGVKANFSDTQGHWAEAAIDTLNSQGIIAGFPEGTFLPDAPVTRAEFAAMVNKAFSDRAPIRSGQDFPDTTAHWASGAIRQANALGFISGYPEGLFGPENNINRVEALVALASGLSLEGSTDLASLYTDADQTPDWAFSQLNAATRSGIRIQGPNPNQLNPFQQASRADIAVFIYQALQGDTTGETDVILSPATAETTWVVVDVTETTVEVAVLGGAVVVGPSNDLKEVAAQQRYSLYPGEFGTYSSQAIPLSEQERLALATSPEVVSFLDVNNWTPEIATQLEPYQVYHDVLLGSGGQRPSADYICETFAYCP